MRTNGDSPVNIKRIREYFSDPRTVEHYVRAVANIGLWESEITLIEKWLDRSDQVLDLGCGAGRIALGLWKMGFKRVQGADLSESMVAEARNIADCEGTSIDFQCEDAMGLSYADERFDAVIFGFNGLMQIPGRENRRQALKEVWRVLKSGGRFLFTTLDRADPLYRSVFRDPDNFEHNIERNPSLLEMGDRHFETRHGTTFMHVPTRDDVLQDLKVTRWILCEDRMRSELSDESSSVREFSEDCRFWVAKKPVA
jgi:SAM-dependent methyltransferase